MNEQMSEWRNTLQAEGILIPGKPATDIVMREDSITGEVNIKRIYRNGINI